VSKHLKIKRKGTSTCLPAIQEKTQWLHVSAFSYFVHVTFISFLPPLYNDKSRSDIADPEGGAYEIASSWDVTPCVLALYQSP